MTRTKLRLDSNMCPFDFPGPWRNLQAKWTEKIGCYDDSPAKTMKVVKRKERAGLGLEVLSVINLDRAPVFVIQEETLVGWRREGNHIPTTLDCNILKRGIKNRQFAQLTSEVAVKPVAVTATDCGALAADIVKNTIRECNKDWNSLRQLNRQPECT